MMFRKTFSALTLAALSVSPLSQAIAQSSAPDNDYWWPNRLDLTPLRVESVGMDPRGEDFDYAEALLAGYGCPRGRSESADD